MKSQSKRKKVNINASKGVRAEAFFLHITAN